MGHRRRPALPSRVEQLRRRIEHWRKTRKKRAPMPDDLWAASVELAQEYGINPIARGLRLSYDSLKSHVATAPKPTPKRRAPAPMANGFVELNPTSLVGTPMLTGPVVELSANDGAKLIIRLLEHNAIDVVGLTNAFLNRR